MRHVSDEEHVPLTQQPTPCKKGIRDKLCDAACGREKLGDIDIRIANIKLMLINGEEKFKELDLHMKELSNGMDNFHDEVQIALNATIDKLANKGETMCLSLVEEIIKVREELDRVLARV